MAAALPHSPVVAEALPGPAERLGSSTAADDAIQGGMNVTVGRGAACQVQMDRSTEQEEELQARLPLGDIRACRFARRTS